MSGIKPNRIALCIPILYAVLTIWIGTAIHAQTQRQGSPNLKETLRWMQTTLENGGGEYEVHHEVRFVRLDDFDGCRVHFSYSTHQVPYANGEPAPEPNKTFHADYYFGLGDIDPTNITFSKGSGIHADDDGLFEVPSFITIYTRNDEKKIASKFAWSEASAKPDDTWLMFQLDSIDADYIGRFAEAFTHAVKMCGGKPSLFTDSDGRAPDTKPPRKLDMSKAIPLEPLTPSASASATPVLPVANDTARKQTPLTTAHRKDIPTIAKDAVGAIVSIVMSDKDGQPIAKGTGFLVSKDGHIVTNYHVIENGSSAIVKLPDGALFSVDGVLAFDKARDVAVIKAHGENFRTLPLGNSDKLQVGEDVVAIGNPLSLESTVSNGILSGIRTSEAKGGKFLQVTTPISPGSSGGPLFNMAGEVVGITTMYLEGGENLNFAIPINDAKRLLLAQSSAIRKLPNEPDEEAPKETHNVPRSYTPPETRNIPRPIPIARIPIPKETDVEEANAQKRQLAFTYCYQNPTSSVLFEAGGAVRSCSGVNENREAWKGCMYSVPICESFLKMNRDLESGILTTNKDPETGVLAMQYIPPPKGILPSNTRIAKCFWTGPPCPAEQTWSDIKYCYQNPANYLQLSDDTVMSCAETNRAREARVAECESKGKKTAETKNCKDFLNLDKALKAGLLRADL